MGLNIRKVGTNLWFLDVRVRKDGQELRRRETFHGTKPAAEERFIALKREIKDGVPSKAPRKVDTFGDVLEVYRERRLALSGLDQTRFNILKRGLGEVALPAFPDSLVEFIRNLRSNASPHTGRPRTNATLNRYITMVRAAFNLAIELGWLEKNPVTKARFPKLKEVPRDKVLTELERHRLLNVVEREAPHLLPVLRFALQVPCRKSELLGMRREDLDLFNNAIRVRNGTTKNDQGCWKPIPPDMVDYFRSLPAQADHLFYREQFGQFGPLGDFKKSWKRCLRLAGIEDFRFHDTRHISASTLLDNGTPEQVVLEVAGWKTNMLRTYYHRAGMRSLGLVRFGAATPSLGADSEVGGKRRRAHGQEK